MMLIKFSRRGTGSGPASAPGVRRGLADPGAPGGTGAASLPTPPSLGDQPSHQAVHPDKDALQLPAEACYTAIFDALSGSDPSSGYRAVAVLSRHLAVARVLLCPTARTKLAPDRGLVTACMAEAQRAQWALRLFDCHLAGEARAVRLPFESVRASLDQHLGSYRTVERAMCAGLTRAMNEPERERLARRYRALLAVAPTRPHPRAPRTGPASKVAFRFHGFIDRLLDTLDSRPGTGLVPV